MKVVCHDQGIVATDIDVVVAVVAVVHDQAECTSRRQSIMLQTWLVVVAVVHDHENNVSRLGNQYPKESAP